MTASELQRFCADAEDIRYYLRAPWSRAEWTYATNGHIMIRVPRLADVEENEKAPDCQGLLAKIPAPTNWMPVPEATTPPDVECDKCHGQGMRECDMGHDHDCDNCNHTGMVRQRIGMDVGGTAFDQRYVSMIQGWEISPAGPDYAAHIRNGDATGLLMPRKWK